MSVLFLAAGSPVLAEDAMTFSGSDLAIAGRPYVLAVPSGGCLVNWGDLITETVTEGTAIHVYKQSEPVSITVTKDGKPVPRDATALFREAKPAWARKAPLAEDVDNVSRPLGALLRAPADSFSVEFRVKSEAVSGNRTFFSSGGPGSAQVGLKDGALVFQLNGRQVMSGVLGDRWTDGAWHHVAVTYDRVPLFPHGNQVRFYLDGLPAGVAAFDALDSGAVTGTAATLGGSGFKGNMEWLAVYDSLLFPLAISDHAAVLAGDAQLPVTVANETVKAFQVDEPKISKVVKLALDSNPSADNGPALRKALVALENGSRLQLTDANGRGGVKFYIRSLQGAPAWAGMVIHDKTDVEVDGNGCTLVFSDNMARYVWMKGCTRTAMRNLAFDIDPLYARVGMWAKLLKVDPATGEMMAQVINPRDGKPVKDLPKRASYWRWRPHDPVTLRQTADNQFKSDLYAVKPYADPSAGPGVIRYKLKVPPTDKLWKVITAYQKGANFYMINNADFSSNAVSLDDSSHITFERVDYHAVLGMVFLSSGIDHVRVVRCKIGLPEGLTAADRPLTAGADGYHFHLTRGSILFEENEIALTDDDPISLKDDLWTDVKTAGPRKVNLGGKGPRAGSPIEILGPDYVTTGFTAKVVASEEGVLTLDRDLPANFPAKAVLVNRSHHTRDWVIRNNYFHDYYGRVMIYTGHGLVTGNRVHDSLYHLGISDAYYERAGIASDIITHRNLFEGTVADTAKWGGDQSLAGFHGITYSANSFLDGKLNINCAADALLTRNWFWRKSGESAYPVEVKNSKGTKLFGNFDAVSPATGFRAKQEKCTGTQEKDNLPAVLTGG
ncbi:LamG domain-containing protein [Luteolibacter sp. LG18]|uniref:LamG domain-containing protein n=1 Tax=Luteolibacter sp. LG18 TaxID=2819286 RepID=UPI0030C6FB61